MSGRKRGGSRGRKRNLRVKGKSEMRQRMTDIVSGQIHRAVRRLSYSGPTRIIVCMKCKKKGTKPYTFTVAHSATTCPHGHPG